MTKQRKKQKKKIKYKKISFKLSEKQKKIVDKFCKAKKTSPNKMIKSAIKDYIQKFADSLPEENYISENQLKLFDIEEEEVQYAQKQEEQAFKGTLF